MPLSVDHLQEFVETTAAFLNMRYFDGSLTFKVEVHKRSVDKWYAKFFFNRDTIVFNPSMCHATIAEMEEVIAHELLHVAQKALGLKMGHGPSFRQVAKQFGIPVESSYTCASSNVRTPRQMRTGEKPRGIKS
jgi:predicted SprT family Zn-dependent metalloprotease